MATIAFDTLNLPRLDLIKIDVEGMELDVLASAATCIAKLHPILLIETIKSDKNELRAWLEKFGYVALETGINYLAIHYSDKCLPHIKASAPRAA